MNNSNKTTALLLQHRFVFVLACIFYNAYNFVFFLAILFCAQYQISTLERNEDNVINLFGLLRYSSSFDQDCSLLLSLLKIGFNCFLTQMVFIIRLWYCEESYRARGATANAKHTVSRAEKIENKFSPSKGGSNTVPEETRKFVRKKSKIIIIISGFFCLILCRS